MAVQPPPIQIPINLESGSMDVAWVQWFTSLYNEGLTNKPRLETKTLSTDADIEFKARLNKTYKKYRIELNNITATASSTVLKLRLSADSGATYESSTVSYDWLNTSHVGESAGETVSEGHTVDYADTALTLTTENLTNISSHNLNGYIEIIDPSSTTKYTTIVWDFRYLNDDGELIQNRGIGRLKLLSAINAVKIYPTMGKIFSGTATLYGLK